MKNFYRRYWHLIFIVFLLNGSTACSKDKTTDIEVVDEKVISIEDKIAKVTFIKSVDLATQTTLHTGVTQVDLKIQTHNDQPLAIYILEVDLNKPDITIKASTPDDKEAFKLQQVSKMAEAADRQGNRVIAAVNADYFLWTGEPWGPLVKDSEIIRFQFADTWHGFFGLTDNGKAMIGKPGDFVVNRNSLAQAVGGTEELINRGKKVSHANKDRHPRTIVGYTKENIVYFIVVDGRKPAHSIGMTLSELSDLMVALGAESALNLDGGGSSTLVVKNSTTNEFEVINRHSDANPRNVANALSIVNTAE